MDGPLEDSPTRVVIPNPGMSGQGSIPMPATLRTPKTHGPAWSTHRVSVPARTRPGQFLPRVPQGDPTLPSWGSIRAAPRTRREGPRPWGLARTTPRPAPSTGDWRGLTGVNGPTSTTRCCSPSRRGPVARTPGECHRPGVRIPGEQAPAEGCRGTSSHYDNCRLQDLERDLEDAQARGLALSSEEECHLQEVLRARVDLRRVETNPSALRRDHATVTGELVRQQSRTRSLEEDGSRLSRQLTDAQRAARDVARAVDERLQRHLPTILKAAQMVQDERVHSPRWSIP